MITLSGLSVLWGIGHGAMKWPIGLIICMNRDQGLGLMILCRYAEVKHNETAYFFFLMFTYF